MNEKIKRLAEQAELIQERDGDVYLLEHATGELEKFAELIILECADIAGDDWDTAGRAILKHFGVNR